MIQSATYRSPALRPAAPALRRTAWALSLLAAAAVLGACSSVPVRDAALEDARARVASAQSDPLVQKHAADELRRAVTALRQVETASAARQPRDEIDHLAYLTERRVTLARDVAATRQAESVVEGARAERSAMLLTQRTQEAESAQRQLAASEQRGVQQGAALAQAARDADADKARIARGDARVQDLQQQLGALNAQRTERGIVVTLGDMLFDSGQARVLPAGNASISALADFMRRNPTRNAMVEGHTDSQGSADANLALSGRRAEAVRAMLVSMGVGAERLTASSQGEGRPMAGNDTADGRRANRRVEIVFATAPGDLVAP